MSALYPTNGTSVLAAASASDGIFDSMVGELTYLAQAMAENIAPMPQAPIMGGVPQEVEEKHDNIPTFGMKPTLH